MVEFSVYVLFFGSLAIGYVLRWRAYLSPVDPLQMLALSEAVWVVTVVELARCGVATPHQVAMFGTCLALWWGCWGLACWLLGPSYRRAMVGFWQRIAAMEPSQQRRLCAIYLAGLSVLVWVTLAKGGGGDNRLVIMKLLKPMESITTLLVPMVLFQLLMARGKGTRVLLVLVLGAMILTGAKSSILSLLAPVTGAALVGRVRLRPRVVALLAFFCISGFGASVMINYKVTNPLDVLAYLYFRISNDADVYLLALPGDLLQKTNTTSLATYLFGPLIKILFLPIPVDTNIGAQIGSLLRGEDTVNGPNPHWPIVLLAYGQSIGVAVLLSLIAFGTVIVLKLRMAFWSLKRRLPIWLFIPLNGYALLYPQSFFSDPSFPLIYLIQAGVLSVLLSIALRLHWVRRHNFRDRLHAAPVVVD